MSEWLPTLKTDTPEEGYNLAVTLARKAIIMTQPNEVIRNMFFGDSSQFSIIFILLYFYHHITIF